MSPKVNRISIVLILGLAFTAYFGCSKVFHLSRTENQNYRISENLDIAEDSSLEEMVAPYKAELSAEMDDTIGQVLNTLTKKQPESDLGNWVTDVILDYTEQQTGKKYDFSIANYGGLRIPALTGGPITVGKIFELMPFDNMIVILHANGEVVRMLFNKMAERGGWPISRGVNYQIKEGVAENILINGHPLDDKTIYHVVMPDFIANGGDNCFFLENEKRTNPQILFRDALIQSVRTLTKAGKEVTSKIENRVRL
jgi:2',3'-cyclic-nucleotide 2'-phosphodiesterase (5'-nucleotidase family)